MSRPLFSRRIAFNVLPHIILAVVVLSTSFAARVSAAPNSGTFVDLVYADATGDHKYVVFVPRDYVPEKKWPVVLYLHGAGERGTDGRKPLDVGLGPYVRQQASTFPALVVFPQCEDLKGPILTAWSADSPDGRRAIEILKAVEQKYSVDDRHRILTGWSMGGYGAWNLAAAMPEFWSAVVPVSGGGSAALASKLKDVPIWAFHGADDVVVRPDESRAIVQAVTAAGGHARYSVIAGAAHDVWKYVYANEGLYRWMLDPAGTNTAQVEFRARPGERAPLQANENEPFLPAVEIHNAVYIRMGNEMLKTLADSVSRNIPADVLSGGIRDIYDSTVTQGYYFRVQLSGISYSGTVERAVVRAYRKDRLNVQLGLRNVHLTIARSYVTGEGHSAIAGPMSIVLGHRSPVWLSLALEPYVENRKLRIRHVGTWFEIPSDNWYVTAPASVSTQGYGMTREAVSGGLVSGIYGKKNRIEQEISAVVPKIVQRIEQNLNPSEIADIVNTFWPLPVYRPRLQVWPQEVSTDEEGVSLLMGVTAAAVDRQHAPAKPQVFDATSLPLAERPRGAGLSVALAPNMLQPLTQLLIDADVARIHLSDIPEKRFALLGDRQALTEAIPELSRLAPSTEIWGELILARPISVLDSPPHHEPPPTEGGRPKPSVATKPVAAIDVPATGASGHSGGNESGSGTASGDVGATNNSSSSPNVEATPHALRISAPQVVIALAIRTDPGQTTWAPFAEITFSVGQEATASIDHPTFQQRVLRLGWTGQPAIECTARFAEGYHAENKKLHVDKIRQLFVDAWKGWTEEGSLANARMSDIDFGLTKLRVDSAQWTGEDLLLGFGPPGVKITNGSDIDLVYETKGPYTGWGGPYTLSPGKSHEFSVASPLIYRRKLDGTYSMFTLPVGSHVEFRRPADGKEPSLVQVQLSATNTKTPGANPQSTP